MDNRRLARGAGFLCLAVAGIMMGADSDARWLVILLLACGAVTLWVTTSKDAR